MKKFTLGLAAFALAGGLFAQSTQLSLGVDLAMPLGDFGDAYGLGVGPTVGFELPITDNLGLTIQAGYDILMPKSEMKDFIKSAAMIPAQAGLKFYFQDAQEGLYGHGQLGIHAMSVKGKEYTIPGIPALGVPETTVGGKTETSTNFSWAVGVGYQMQMLDLGLRYNSISPDSDNKNAKASSYIGVRAAFLINLN